LRRIENCIEVTKGCNQVFNLAADMGGMGFIESNQSVLLFNNTMLSFNMLEASRMNGMCDDYKIPWKKYISLWEGGGG
jgi:GDP-D-mannose 3', 5'-epimerase